MGITNGGQLQELFMGGGRGFLLGAFYDVFRVIRLLMRPSAKVVFFQDLLFFALSSVVTFLFALAVTGGELRFYLFLGLVTGFMAYYFTIGRAVMRCAKSVIAAILWLWHGLWKAIFFPFRLLWKLLRRPISALARFFCKIGRPAADFFKKIAGNLKKVLQRPLSVLYNQKE